MAASGSFNATYLNHGLVLLAGKNPALAASLLEGVQEADKDGTELEVNDPHLLGLFGAFLMGLREAPPNELAWPDINAFLDMLYDHGVDPQKYSMIPDTSRSLLPSEMLTMMTPSPFQQELEEWFEAHPTKKTGGLTKGLPHGNANFSDSQIISALRKTGANPGAAAELLFKP